MCIYLESTIFFIVLVVSPNLVSTSPSLLAYFTCISFLCTITMSNPDGILHFLHEYASFILLSKKATQSS